MSVVIAMGGIYLGTILFVGFGVAFPIAIVLVFSPGRRSPAEAAKGNVRDRGAGLGGLALACGPLVGLAVGFLICRFGDVDPQDASALIWFCLCFGVVAGAVVATSFAIASAFAPKAGAKGPDPEL